MLEFLKNVTPLQWFGVIVLFNGTVVGGTAALTQMGIPAGIVQAMSAFCGLANVFLGGLVTMFGGQTAQLRNVAATLGDDGKPALRINVNANASTTLAAVAIDPTQKNIGAATPETRAVLLETAKGG